MPMMSSSMSLSAAATWLRRVATGRYLVPPSGFRVVACRDASESPEGLSEPVLAIVAGDKDLISDLAYWIDHHVRSDEIEILVPINPYQAARVIRERFPTANVATLARLLSEPEGSHDVHSPP
jgi:hypothetical protein